MINPSIEGKPLDEDAALYAEALDFLQGSTSAPAIVAAEVVDGEVALFLPEHLRTEEERQEFAKRFVLVGVDLDALDETASLAVHQAMCAGYTMGRLDQIEDTKGSNVRRFVRADELQEVIESTGLASNFISSTRGILRRIQENRRALRPRKMNQE